MLEDCGSEKEDERSSCIDMGRIEFPLLYDRVVNPKKISDLLELLDFVPPIHHAFYRTLNQRMTECSSESESHSSDED